MESSAETVGEFRLDDGVAATRTSCILSDITITVKDVSTFETWDHQKMDFIRGHSDDHSCITDEQFMVHLLEVHAQLCADSLCKCRCSTSNDTSLSHNPCEEHVSQNSRSISKTVTDSKAFITVTAPATNKSSDDFHIFQLVCKPESRTDGDAVTSMLATDSVNEENPLTLASTSRKRRDSSPSKSSDGIYGVADKNHCLPTSDNAGEVEVTRRMKIEPPDPLSHDHVTCDSTREFKQDAVDMIGSSEVDSKLEALPTDEATKNDRLQEVAIVSPDPSHDQDLVVKIKVESVTSSEEIIDDHSGSQCQMNSETLDTTSGNELDVPRLRRAKIVLKKLDIQQIRAKCRKCHKAVQGTNFQCSVDGKAYSSILKCDRCREDEAPELQEQGTVTEVAVSKGKPVCRPAHQRASNTHTAKSDDSGKLSHQTNVTLAGKKIPSSDLGESTEQAHQEGEMGTCSSLIIPKVQSERPSSCRNCLEKFSRKHELLRPQTPQEDDTGTCSSTIHSATHELESPLICRICQRNFNKKQVLARHITAHTRERPFSGRVCPKSFSQKFDLARHSMTHTVEKLFSCTICKKDFTHKGNLKLHMRTHTGERPFSCSVCPKSFIQKCELKKHSMIHTSEKAFSCRVCTKSFIKKSYLKQHSMTHTAEKLFSCTICKKNFTRKGNLKVHMRTHTGERPFSCRVCPKSFYQKGDLARHSRTHTGEKPFSCRVCLKSFTRKGDLKKHSMTHTCVKALQLQHL